MMAKNVGKAGVNNGVFATRTSLKTIWDTPLSRTIASRMMA